MRHGKIPKLSEAAGRLALGCPEESLVSADGGGDYASQLPDRAALGAVAGDDVKDRNVGSVDKTGWSFPLSSEQRGNECGTVLGLRFGTDRHSSAHVGRRLRSSAIMAGEATCSFCWPVVDHLGRCAPALTDKGARSTDCSMLFGALRGSMIDCETWG